MGLKTQKTGLSLAVIAIPKPVFSGFTVFWAVFALKTRKLPDLSGRQIRQLLCDNSTKRNIEKGVCSKSAHGLELLSRIDRYFSLRESISATFLCERRFFTYLIRKFSLLKKALAPCMVVTTVTMSRGNIALFHCIHRDTTEATMKIAATIAEIILTPLSCLRSLASRNG